MIYVFFAPGFEEIEAITPLDILRRAELEVRSVGVGGKTVTGSHKITVECDLAETRAVTEGLDMIVLPGGMPGTLNLEKSPVVQGFIDHCAANGLWIGANCAAPSILGHKGLLEGRTVTCFPGYETQLGEANYTGNLIEADGKIITGRGPGASVAFSLRLVECLLGAERAKRLGEAMQC